MKIMLCALGALAAGLAGGACGDAEDGLRVDDVSPAVGGLAGGDTLTLTGVGFRGDGDPVAYVLIGDRLASDVRVLSDESLTVTTPPSSAAGPADIVVVNGRGQAVARLFSYVVPPTISELSPANGAVSGGTEVTILGSGFGAGTAEVWFGDIAATDVTLVDDATVVATTPPGTLLQLADVEVRTATGLALREGAYVYGAQGAVLARQSSAGSGVTWADLSVDPPVLTDLPGLRGGGGSDRYTGLAQVGGRVFAVDSSPNLYALHGGGRELIAELDSRLCSLAEHQGRLFAASKQTGSLIELSTLDGSILWSAPVAWGAGNALASDGDTLWAMVSGALVRITPDDDRAEISTVGIVEGLAQCMDLGWTGADLLCTGRYNSNFFGGGGGEILTLLRINPTTAEATPLATTAFSGAMLVLP